jgi:hypothetical protein
MDIKEKVEEIVAKIKKDPALIKNFKDDPVKTIESLSGIDIPDGMEDKVVTGVKTAMAKDAAGGVLDSVKKLF